MERKKIFVIYEVERVYSLVLRLFILIRCIILDFFGVIEMEEI